MSDSERVASDTVLEEAPGRVLTFLRGIALNPVIFAQLAAVGFTPAEYQLGWSLLHAASGYVPALIEAPPRSPAFLAMQELDAWDEDGFRRISAPLERLHPEQADFVFAGGLAASTGPKSVVGVKLLLDRLDALESSEERQATSEADHAALETLANRGIDKAERDRLRALVVTAQTLEAPAVQPGAPDAAERKKALEDLYLWFKDWSRTAHSVIKKRSHLITLGLATRKSPKKKAEANKPEAESEEQKSEKKGEG